MPTTNEQLRDRAIRHAVYLQRMASREAAAMRAFINRQLLPSVVAQIQLRLAAIDERGYDLGPTTTARLQALETVLRQIVADTVGAARESTIARLRELAAAEGQFAMGVIGVVAPVALDTILPTPEALRAAAVARPFEGEAIRGWYDQLETSTATALTRELRIGMAAGETIPQIAARIRGTAAAGFADGILETTRAQAEAIARSGVIHVSSQAREMSYAANEDLIEGVQWVSTLDARTCEECGSLDGKVFSPGEGRRPPAHFNCRCTTTPILKSWKALGIDLAEAPEGTRASLDGQVPATTTYGEWLRGQPKGVVVEALGPSRADLFLKGKLPIESFVDRRGNTLTLEQLQKREADAFRRAGVDPGG